MILIALRQMPTLLRILTFLAAACSLTTFTIVPQQILNFDGHNLSYRDAWARGYIPAYFCFGILSAFQAYGFLKARRWSRPLFPVFLTALITMDIWLDLAPAGRPDTAEITLNLLLIALLLWYLFFKQSVRTYFDCKQPPIQPPTQRSFFWRPKRRLFPDS